MRHRLVADPSGFDAIDDYDLREWLLMNGARERSVHNRFLRGFYDACFSYDKDDLRCPRMSAGTGLRVLCGLLFSYRGPFYWRMNAGMGDVVFAPFYEVLKRRGVRFEFFHRLTNVSLVEETSLAAGASPYVDALEFDVQAEVGNSAGYDPLVNVRGLPCWPSSPDYDQLTDGDQLRQAKWNPENYEDSRRVSARRLKVSADFDFAVLAIGLGAIPDVCSEFLERNESWRLMVDRVGTAATQAFQIWLADDMQSLGWKGPPANLSGFVDSFSTWTDMSHLIPEENWLQPPQSIAYFCSFLEAPNPALVGMKAGAFQTQTQLVHDRAIRFINMDLPRIWHRTGSAEEGFRWSLLVHPSGVDVRPVDEGRFDTQYWRANIHPSDRYVLSLPGSSKYRISPLDNTYDNLTIAGDWTNNGINAGSVEAAMISGRVAAHALSGYPLLEEIVGFDCP